MLRVLGSLPPQASCGSRPRGWSGSGGSERHPRCALAIVPYRAGGVPSVIGESPGVRKRSHDPEVAVVHAFSSTTYDRFWVLIV